VRKPVVVLLASLLARCAPDPGSAPTRGELPPNPKLAPDAPPDRPVEATGTSEVEAYRAAIAPYVAQGRKTYPEAKRRFMAGLPEGHHFFVVTDIRDGSGGAESVFITVARIEGGRITGRIACDVLGVQGFKNGDPYTFEEGELVDWVITRPDGTEEGNAVGKFLDEWQKTRPRKK
jgi:hypothetical protein